MTEQEFNQALKAGNVNFKSLAQLASPEDPQPEEDMLAGFRAVLTAIRRPRQARGSAPTFVPKTLIDQIQFYDDGSEQRIYFYINNTWRYATLT